MGVMEKDFLLLLFGAEKKICTRLYQGIATEIFTCFER
jgi:hypothetical protein